jgi:hypothetical protein
MPELSGEKIIKRADKLFASDERTNVDSNWDLLAEYILPSQAGNFLTNKETKGAVRTNRVYDSTAQLANRDLASSIHGVLTNPAFRWAKFRFSNEELNNDADAVTWLEQTNSLFHDALNQSNFATEISKGYQMYSALGSMAILQEEGGFDDSGVFQNFVFRAVHLGELAWSENVNGIVDVVYRKFKLTGRQLKERWEDKLDHEILELIENDPEKEFEIYHCLDPREPKEVEFNEIGLAAPNKRPIRSMYILKKTKTILEEGGFYEFPIHVVRWETTPGEVYGRGPGLNALPDVRTLNRAEELFLQGWAKAINPPLLAEQRNILGQLDLRPGQISVVKDKEGIREMIPGARFDVSFEAARDRRDRIKAAFFIDKLLLPPRTETGEMTAFEVSMRTEQMQRVLGPTLGRLNAELLDPMVRRGFNMMLRGGAFPQLPPALQASGSGIEVEYVNALARSQKAEDISNIQSWVQDLAFIAQFRPEAVDFIDVDGIAKHTAKIRGVPEIAVTDDKAVDQLRQQRQEQLDAQQQLEAGIGVADIASKLGGAGGLGGAE